MVADAFDKLVRTEQLSTWSERLAEYNGQEAAARLILNKLSQAEAGMSRDQLLTVYSEYFPDISHLAREQNLSHILNMIEHDGYIIRTKDGKRRFRSPLLKNWWYYKFVA